MEAEMVSDAPECSSTSTSMEECLKLLKGERDEQRLAGLLVVTKLCKAEDHSSLRRVYDAVGTRFLDRLLRTGMGKAAATTGNGHNNNNDNRDAYLRLSVTVLAAFCRVPEIASSEDMVSKIPLVLEVMSTQYACSFSFLPLFLFFYFLKFNIFTFFINLG